MIPPTEQRNGRTDALGSSSINDVVGLLDAEEQQAFDAVIAARAQLVEAARLVAAAYDAGHRIAYLATGTSGALAAMDAAELPATFGTDGTRYLALVTTNPPPAAARLRGASEDDVDVASRVLGDLGFGPGDVVIGIAASGTTPLVVAGVDAAGHRGCATVGIANNPDTPLLALPDVGVLLDTGPEALTGSTRLKAGTAQKLALNRISTAAMVSLGFVVSNHMIALRPVNAKLRARAVRIVVDLTGVSDVDATALLVEHDWSVRDAVASAP